MFRKNFKVGNKEKRKSEKKRVGLISKKKKGGERRNIGGPSFYLEQ